MGQTLPPRVFPERTIKNAVECEGLACETRSEIQDNCGILQEGNRSCSVAFILVFLIYTLYTLGSDSGCLIFRLDGANWWQ